MCKEQKRTQKSIIILKATIDYKRFSKTASTPLYLDRKYL